MTTRIEHLEGSSFKLESELWVPAPVEEVFPFFANAANLEELTPPWLNFSILNSRSIVMREGAEIDYRLRLHGVPVSWRSRITAWSPNRRFVDEQVRGPYRSWKHEHLFEPVMGGTLCRDRVYYTVPGGRLVHRFMVEPDLRRIFDYRHLRLAERFSERSSEASNARSVRLIVSPARLEPSFATSAAAAPGR